MLNKCFKRSARIMGRPFLVMLGIIAPMALRGQFGIVLAPYFVTPNFGSVCYGLDAHKIGNNQSIGGIVHLNFNRRFSVNVTHLEFGGDRMGTYKPGNLGYGVGTQPVYTYLPIKNSEVTLTWFYSVKELSGRMDFWGGDKLAKAFGLRVGGIQSQRMVQIKPTKVNYTYEQDGNTVQGYDYVSWYDITGLKQKIAYAGLEIDKYKSVEQYRNIFNRDAAQQRKRLYQQYFDVMYGFSQQYADYGTDSFSFSGSSVKNINPFGWRLGLRRVTYNHLAHSFVCEIGQFPGQRRIPDTGSGPGEIPVDDNPWKNWFVFVGFNFCIGHWFGDYE